MYHHNSIVVFCQENNSSLLKCYIILIFYWYCQPTLSQIAFQELTFCLQTNACHDRMKKQKICRKNDKESGVNMASDNRYICRIKNKKLFFPKELKNVISETMVITIGINSSLLAFTKERWDIFVNTIKSIPVQSEALQLSQFFGVACETKRNSRGAYAISDNLLQFLDKKQLKIEIVFGEKESFFADIEIVR